MKRKVAVVGSTGLVGQRFVSLLSGHPWFEIAILTGSESSAGKLYGESVRWSLEEPMPPGIGEYRLEKMDVTTVAKEAEVAFIALPPDEAEKVEVELAKRGVSVISNASNRRLEPDIPLINPEVNAHHLEAIENQRRKRGWSGSIVKVPNCTASILTLSLKPLLDDFGIRRVIASSMQAISGAGLKGLPSMYILDNLIPYIEGEEEKVENETLKILGEPYNGEIHKNSSISISASCHRVMVLEGHTIAVFVELEREAHLDEVIRSMEEFRGDRIKNKPLPSKPERPIIVRKEEDRPQPRLDRNAGRGMSVVVGRIREDRALGGVKYVVLGHNTIRGAAGTGVLIAELMLYENLL